VSRLPVFLLLLGALAATGCGSEPPAGSGAAQSQASAPAGPTSFDPAACGTITGLVSWTGPIPEVTPALAVSPQADGTGYDVRELTPANAPRIDRFTRGVGGVVVYLREVNPVYAKPWDLPAVTVEFRDSQIQVKQGARTARTGFVRRGGEVTFQSAEPSFQSLRGRGAAFFALPFPDANQPLTRTFDNCGIVELTSASGLYWQSAELFVCDHPYYTVSGPDGRFEFTQVPTGKYDLVAWHPNWVPARTERNPESGQPNRLHYAPPLESSRPVGVIPGRFTLANLTFPK
jgi:hypothetical protein